MKRIPTSTLDRPEGQRLVGTPVSSLSTHPQCAHRANNIWNFIIESLGLYGPRNTPRAPHDSTVDWWSVGVIAYELLTGIPPFNAKTPDKVFENVLNHNIKWPSDDEISKGAKSFIRKLA